MTSLANEVSEKGVLLNPRPYGLQELTGRLLLLPLLPQKKPLKTLPAEIWTHIFSLLEQDSPGSLAPILTVCKAFMGILLPLLYSSVRPSSLTSFDKLLEQLSLGESRWDSLRRIPYSTPGRWIMQLDLSRIKPLSQAAAHELDAIITMTFPLLPFLARLVLNPAFSLSRRAISSLAQHVGVVNLKALEGIGYHHPDSQIASSYQEDPLVDLLRNCINLEVLELVGQGMDPTEQEISVDGSPRTAFPTSVSLPFARLKVLTLLSIPSSHLFHVLLASSLPNLRHLTITPYDDIPYPTSLTSQFIATHGTHLHSLVLITPKAWPTRRHLSPVTLLQSCFNARHLSLETPVPHLEPPFEGGEHKHLQVITIPRPSQEFWSNLVSLLPRLPALKAIRIRDVKWLRKGLALHAQHAGVQGQMKDWRTRLARRGIMMLDAEWKEDFQ